MSYATVDQLRVYLDMDTETEEVVLQDLLDRANSAINLKLGFAFKDLATGPASITRKLDSAGDEYLYLPSPGAKTITTVVENGVSLSSSNYEIDPVYGKYLLRLDDSGYLTPWLSSAYLELYGGAYGQREFAPPRLVRQRLITVTFVPNDPPAALVQAELAEATRLWIAKAAGYSDAVGIPGTTERIYTKSMLSSTKDVISDLQLHYGDSAGGGVAGA